MADKLGPGSFNALQVTINTMIQQESDITLQILNNDMSGQITHLHSANDTTNIQNKYDPEIRYYRNEMRSSDDKTSAEYYELMSEVEELEDERDSKIKMIENELSDKEKKLEIEKTNLETRLNAVKADKEGLEDIQKQSLERS